MTVLQKCSACPKEFEGPTEYAGYRKCRACEYEELSRRWKNVPGTMFRGERDCLLTLQQEENKRLQAVVDDLLSSIEEVGVGLFGPDDGRSWRDAKASWWQSLLKAVAAAKAAKESSP